MVEARSVRRRLGVVLLLISAALGALYLVGRKDSAQPPRQAIPRARHNLLLITVDTTRPDRLEPYGASNVATPTLARLAETGIVFERAYAVAPITLVAHTSILTGLYPPQHGVRNNGSHHAAPELTTLAETLRDAGYRTAAFVSAAVLERRYGLDQGFEVYDDDLSSGRERHPRMVPDRPANAVVDAARAWLDGLGPDERFFAWVHCYDPHAAYSPPPPYRDTYRERPYDGEIAFMDAELGRLLEHPRAAADDVVVSVIGDHGEALGEHGESTHAVLAYDATMHVPWLLRVPGGPRGARVPTVVDQVDLLPTVLDLLGLPAPADVAGDSLTRQLEGIPDEASAPRPRYGETYLPYYTYRWAKLKVLRRGTWKYIDAPSPELYDLQRDPDELTNLHPHQPGLAHDFARDLEEWLAATGEPEREAALELDSESIEKLQSLGYLGVGVGDDDRDDEVLPDPKDLIDLHVRLELARHLARDRLFEQAADKLEGLLERDPANLAALIDLAGVLEQAGEIDRAQTAAERALALAPEFPRLHLILAGLEARRGRDSQALELLGTALELDPRYLEAEIAKARLLIHLGRGEEGRALLERCLAANPDHAALNAQYAQLVELADGRLDAAEARLRTALERDPFLVYGWLLLGDVLERQENQTGAVAAYRNGLARAPDDVPLHARLGLLLAGQHHGAEAERHLREAIRLSPTQQSELHVALGGWLAERGRLEEADAEYARVLARDPRHPGARNNRAIALYGTGRRDQARDLLTTLVAEFPQHADAHNNLAAIAIAEADWQTAERHARAALAVKPRFVEAWNNLGVALEELGRRGEARDAYDRGLLIDPDYWQARLNRAVILIQLGEHDAARAELARVLDLVPGQAEAHYRLGELFVGPLADPRRARLHWNAFVRAAPNDPRAEQTRLEISRLPSPDEP